MFYRQRVSPAFATAGRVVRESFSDEKLSVLRWGIGSYLYWNLLVLMGILVVIFGRNRVALDPRQASIQ